MEKALKTAAKLALRPYAGRGWTLQMFSLSETDFTVLYGKHDPDTLDEEGVRVTATLVRTDTEQKIAISLVTI